MLGEHEGLAPIGIESSQQIDRTAIGSWCMAIVEGTRGSVEQPATSNRSTHCIGAHASGDRQQPWAHGRATLERVHRPEHPFVGLLHEVGRVLGVSQLSTQRPQRGLGPSHEFGEGGVVALPRRQQQRQQGVRRHVPIMAR